MVRSRELSKCDQNRVFPSIDFLAFAAPPAAAALRCFFLPAKRPRLPRDISQPAWSSSWSGSGKFLEHQWMDGWMAVGDAIRMGIEKSMWVACCCNIIVGGEVWIVLQLLLCSACSNCDIDWGNNKQTMDLKWQLIGGAITSCFRMKDLLYQTKFVGDLGNSSEIIKFFKLNCKIAKFMGTPTIKLFGPMFDLLRPNYLTWNR